MSTFSDQLLITRHVFTGFARATPSIGESRLCFSPQVLLEDTRSAINVISHQIHFENLSGACQAWTTIAILITHHHLGNQESDPTSGDTSEACVCS